MWDQESVLLRITVCQALGDIMDTTVILALDTHIKRLSGFLYTAILQDRKNIFVSFLNINTG